LLGALILLLGAGRDKLSLLVRDRTSQLQFQALHDSLTGLPNRALIVDRIEQMLERNRRRGTQGAALFVDLDDFKNVNDSLGHEAGDHLLVLVAWRMKSTLRGADTIGRMGGDEFVVLIDGGADTLAPEIVAQRLLDVMRQPFVLKGALIPLYVSTSVGIAVGDRQNGSELLRDADVALYQAKNAGKNKFAFFNSKMADVSERRIALEFDLRSAIRDNQFHLVYQPIYRLEDLSVIGVEALLRWHHPSEGVICPDEFIPILERTGQIREVGAWVLREACRQMTDWRARGYDLDVSVNVSARQFDDDLIVDQIREASRIGGCERSLIVEVTETALMLDVDATVRRLTLIKELGVRVAIDDFGTGYCSLAYLRKFPIDCIKIDQSFIASITTSTHSAALVKTFIQLGRDLGVTTLAEGVETIEQMDMLRASGVTEVQGYLFARPLDPLALETQILESTRHQKPQTRPRSL
jgi:diguanylate cyclase (GGDEF)-like protein